MNTTHRQALSSQILLFFLLATGTMMFATFTASYMVRRTGADWATIPMPGILWISTAVIGLSSGSIEVARRFPHLRRIGVGVTVGLGVIFAVLQVAAWSRLRAQGLYLSTNPHSSFFFMLTGVHSVHLLAGLVVLGVVMRDPRGRNLDLGAAWWHFVGLLWIYLLALLWVF